MHIFSGLVGIAAGFLLIRYAVPLVDMFGKVDWAEANLRGGLAGTYSLYKIVGIVFIIFSLLYMFGVTGFLLGPVGSVFGGAKPQ
jgi:hypothetical protein